MRAFIMICTGIAVMAGCSPAACFNKDRKAFEAAKTIMSFKAVADMNDAHFDIKENNYMEFYRELFDSVKNTSYPGKYSLKGDTMLLSFYNKKAAALLGTKAVVNEKKKQIIFFR